MDATDPWVLTAIAELRAASYSGDFAIEIGTIPPSLLCHGCHRYLLPRTLTIDAVRSSGSRSDDPDRTVVFALKCPRCGTAGALVGRRVAAMRSEESGIVAELESRAHPPAAPAGPPIPEVGARIAG